MSASTSESKSSVISTNTLFFFLFFWSLIARGSELAPGKESLRNEAIPKSAARVLNAQAIRDEWKLKKRKLEDGDGKDGRGGKRRKTTGRITGSEDKEKSKKTSLTIQPWESIENFNRCVTCHPSLKVFLIVIYIKRRVEDDLRPLVKSAVESSRAITRNKARAEKVAYAEAKKAAKLKRKGQSTEETTRDISPPPPPRIDDDSKHTGRPKEFQVASSSVPRRLNDIAKAPPEFKKLPRGASSSSNTITGRADGVLSMSQKLMMEQERTMVIARYRELKAERQRAGDRGDN